MVDFGRSKVPLRSATSFAETRRFPTHAGHRGLFYALATRKSSPPETDPTAGTCPLLPRLFSLRRLQGKQRTNETSARRKVAWATSWRPALQSVDDPTTPAARGQQKKWEKFRALRCGGVIRRALVASGPLTQVSYLYKLGGMGGLYGRGWAGSEIQISVLA